LELNQADRRTGGVSSDKARPVRAGRPLLTLRAWHAVRTLRTGMSRWTLQPKCNRIDFDLGRLAHRAKADRCTVAKFSTRPGPAAHHERVRGRSEDRENRGNDEEAEDQTRHR
jgi:hypothetical protein